MKLFYIANARVPTEKAHGLQILKMCEAFAATGLEVELIVPKRTNETKENIFKFYQVKDSFSIKELRVFDPSIFFKQGRVLIYLQALFFALSVFFYVLNNRNEFGRSDVFYLRDEFSPWLLSFLNKKVFYEVHAFSKKFRYYRPFFSKISGLVLITQRAKEEFIELGMKKEKILISPDAVDTEIFDLDISAEQASKNLGLPLDKKILVYTGKFKTMGMDKGINDILETLKIIEDERVMFLAIGGAEKEIKHYQKKTEELGLRDKVLLLGHKTQQELALYQKAADILLMPFPYTKHYAFYMSPLKMFEYMAAKRPIIATDLPSVREILNESNSVLVEPGNHNDLAGAIKKLLADQELGRKIYQQAFDDVQKYTWLKRAEAIMEFIRN